MVEGFESFREKFREYGDCYTIIGGTACDILMSEANLDFRRTKDLDIILILEEKGTEFGTAFWEYIKEGRYKCGWRNSEEAHFYRFTKPMPGYPAMIELFSRKPGWKLENDGDIAPVHIDEDISSLSAILLNDDFYEFMMKGRRMANGVSVLSAEYLIPFKMYAWIDIKRRKESGTHANTRDYKKHKNDVFRLLRIVNPDETIKSDGAVKKGIEDFLTEIVEEPVDTEQLGLLISFEEALDILRRMYL